MKRAISVHTRDLLDVDFGFESRFRDTSRHTHTHTQAYKRTRTIVFLVYLRCSRRKHRIYREHYPTPHAKNASSV